MFHFSINSITIFQATSSRLRKVLQPGEYKFEGGIGGGCPKTRWNSKQAN